jgi:hypothetical protein
MLIQDIEEMRRQEGIEDPELREQIGRLKRGDFVKLTFLAGTNSTAGETLQIRITSIRNGVFRGKLVKRPSTPGLSQLDAEAAIVFTAAHIHSLSGKRPAVPSIPRLMATSRPARR